MDAHIFDPRVISLSAAVISTVMAYPVCVALRWFESKRLIALVAVGFMTVSAVSVCSLAYHVHLATLAEQPR